MTPLVRLSATGHMLRQPSNQIALVLLVCLSTVLSFVWMSTYQPQVHASRASLIYLLETVFGSLASLAWGHDAPSWFLALGGALILGGNVAVEFPGWWRATRR